jgi:hypothetical protein
MFHGSYQENDVSFLLKIIDLKTTDVAEKEKAIQSGKKHYSEMLSPEYLPSEKYLNIFRESMKRNLQTFSQDILNLAYLLPKDVSIVSLARGGTPIGVIVKRIILERFKIDIPHYSISIIRDRGIDENALKYILKRNEKILFLDGWTGKGVIGRELKKFVEKFNAENKTEISTKLHVLADISGTADFSVTNRDYLIPSSALNSTISGLISRTVLNDLIGKDDFHGSVYYKEFEKHDFSVSFVEKVVETTRKLEPNLKKFISNRKEFRQDQKKKIDELMRRYEVENYNFLKPGVAETTRVLLRRVPERILLKDLNNPDTKHLIQLSNEKDVPFDEVENLPFSAIGIIKKVSN